jgi:hypothetical protein
MDVFDVRFVTPFSMGVYGSRLSGKTVFVKNLLLMQNDIINEPFKKVIWIYNSWQEDLFRELMNGDFQIKFLDDLPDFKTMKKQENTVIVIDDYMEEASKSDEVEKLFTRGRHLNISVIFLSQNLFHQGKHSRGMTLNTDYMVVFRNVRDVTQIATLARQMYKNKSEILIDAYEMATKKPYGNLVIELRPNGIDQIRLRSNILDSIKRAYVPKNL